MATKSMRLWKVNLGATLPATATMEVEATSEAEAREYAEANGEEADWNGADTKRPQGCDIEIIAVEEIKRAR